MLITLLTFGVCLAGGFVPAISADLYLLGAAALVGPAMLPVLVVAATIGQVAGKAGTYLLAGCAAPRRRPAVDRGRPRRSVRQFAVLARHRPWLACGLVALSALVSVPPFFAVAAACGVLRLGLVRFLVAAAGGRLIRNVAIVAVPFFLRGA